MQEIHGNKEGIKNATLERLAELYEYEFDQDEFAPVELLKLLAQFSVSFNREIALYVSRYGEILDIVIGEQNHVNLPSFSLRRSQKRLSMVRVIHTHPKCSGALSDVDITALRSLYLDAMMAVGTDSQGNVTDVSCAFLGEKVGGIPTPILSPLYTLKKLPQKALMDQILVSESLVMQGEEKAQDEKERALLVSIDSEYSLYELKALAESAGAIVVEKVLQKKQKPDTATYVGSGKAQSLSLTAQAVEADVVIVDDELTGAQTRNLEELIGVKVIDRTTLILDIFAQRAKTNEGKLQVQLAQLQYRQSRLIGQGLVLSRLAGGIGTRGPGESKLEMDRRRIRDRIVELRRNLQEMEKQRALRRKSREKNSVPMVALVGYTNTGKSTLLNKITNAGVYAENKLFATLDAVSRKVELKDQEPFILTDTVGFISKLPTDLVEAFHSTLEEAAQADLLLIVSDLSAEDMAKQHAVVLKVLEKLGAEDIERIDVLNKCDKALEENACVLPAGIPISAKMGDNLPQLLDAISTHLKKKKQVVKVHVPFSNYQMATLLRNNGTVLSEKHTDTGTELEVCLPSEALARLKSKMGKDFTIVEAENAQVSEEKV